MADKKYTITNSNFTIKKKHKSSADSILYERDFMTTTNLGGWDSGTIPWGESNFKMTTRVNDEYTKRKHKFGEWIKQNVCEEAPTYWTLNCIGNNTIGNSKALTSEGTIKLNPNYTSFLDFAYYGSCTELVKSSITDIISKFPGELYVTDDNSLISGETLYLIDNPFLLDIYSKYSNSENKYRYFCNSYSDYIVYANDGKSIAGYITGWETDINDNVNKCVDGSYYGRVTLTGDIVDKDRNINNITIDIYYFNQKKCYFTTANFKEYHIRLKDEVLSDFFEKEMDDFERLLLNIESNPLYMMEIDYPHETENGIETYKKRITWPTRYGWNIDVTSMKYAKFLNEILNLANFYDERQTDNLWRMMVHDSIKNMDLTFTNANGEDRDDYREGITKIEGLFWAYGRQFDELKRSIDNIKYVNKITYDGNNNLPDYFLSDSLNMSGWEVYSVNSQLDSEDVVCDELFKGKNKTYDIEDLNITFMKNLKINSKDIFKHKGTKQGIEMILGLFGLTSYDFAKAAYNANYEGKWSSLPDFATGTTYCKEKLYDYKIKEEVGVVQNVISGDADELLAIEKYNAYKKTYENDGFGEIDTLEGLPVIMVYYNDIKYIIPWFSRKKTMDGTPYFQMYGGWGKTDRREINEESLTYLKEISGDTIYDETEKYLKIVEKPSELVKIPYGNLNNGDIYYVYDVSENTGYTSNYFYIKDKEKCDVIGGDGWNCISSTDIKEGKNMGLKVLYLESIIDECRGNNPHVGYGKYDNGEEYFEIFKQIFKYSIENDNFNDDAYSCDTGTILDEIKNIGFNILKQEDNAKCWYFTNNDNEPLKRVIYSGNTYVIDETEYPVNIGASGNSFYSSSLIPFNFEGGELNDESAANSIINSKKLTIVFDGAITRKYGFRKYLEYCIMPYLKQMIPSTTIFNYEVVKTYEGKPLNEEIKEN